MRPGPAGIVAAAAGVAYLVLATSLDWWQFNQRPEQLAIWTARLFGAATTATATVFVLKFLMRTALSTRILMVLWTAYLGALLAVAWPGFSMTDTYAAYKYSLSFPFNDWLGFFTPLQYFMALQLVPKFWFLVILQALFGVLALGLWDHVLRSHGARPWLRAMPHVLLAVSVGFLHNILFLNRDTLFCVMHLPSRR